MRSLAGAERKSVHGSRSKKLESKKKITDSKELRKKTSSEVFLSAVERGAQSLDAEGFLDVEAKDVVVLFQDFKGEVWCCIWMCVGVAFSLLPPNYAHLSTVEVQTHARIHRHTDYNPVHHTPPCSFIFPIPRSRSLELMMA